MAFPMKHAKTEDSCLLKAEFLLCVEEKQNEVLFQWSGGCRAMWNFFLAEIKARYLDTGQFRFYYENAEDLSKLKAFPEYSWLRDIPSQALQQTLMDLNKSLDKFIKDMKNPKLKPDEKAGFPGFKKKKRGIGSFHFAMVNFHRNIKVIDSIIYFKYKGQKFKIKCKLDEIPRNFKSACIKHKAGNWYISFTYEKAKQPGKPNRKAVTGLDLNSKMHVAEDGEHPVVKPFTDNQGKLVELQRSLSRKVKGSNNYNKVLLKLQKLNKHCANAQKDFAHKLTKHLVDSYETIVIEDLDNKGIQKKFGKVIANNSFGSIRQMLEYKCPLYGSKLVVVDRYYPNSQLCSCCGYRQKLKLSQRVYNCPKCGLSICRDKNSELNLRKKGLELTPLEQMNFSSGGFLLT